MVAGADLRIGDAEREAAAGDLREHFAQGRLTREEFTQRLDAVFAAKTRSQLSAITSDLPRAAQPSLPGPQPSGGPGGHSWTASTSGPGGERDGHGHGPGAGFIPVIIAALAVWLLIADLSLRSFPWPGKLAISLAILGLVRRLLRQLLRHRARGRRGPRQRGGYRRR